MTRERFWMHHAGHRASCSWSIFWDRAQRCIRPSWVIQSTTELASSSRWSRSATGNRSPTFCFRTDPLRWTWPSLVLTRCCCCSWTDPSAVFEGLASDISSSAPRARTRLALCCLAECSPCRNHESGSEEISGDDTRLERKREGVKW